MMNPALPALRVSDSHETLVLPISNDSTLTLVTPLPSVHTVLTLSSDSVLNTSFISRGQAIYKLKSNGTATQTDLIRCAGGGRAEDEVVASYSRRLLGNVILRPDGEKVKTSKWTSVLGKKEDEYVNPLESVNQLSTSPIRYTLAGFDRGAAPMSFTSGGKVYVWRMNIAGQMAVRPSLSVARTSA
jgi:hypothetical protein